MLSRYGITLEEGIPEAEKFAAALAKIQEQFGGQARAQAETFSGVMQQLKNAFGDLQEKVGDAIIKNEGLRDGLKKLTQTLASEDAVNVVVALGKAIGAMTTAAVGFATAIPNFLREWEAEWTTGLNPHWYVDGNDYFGQVTESGDVMGNVRLVVDSNSTAISQYYDKGEAGTTDFLRLQATGGTIAATGTAYDAVFEFGLVYENVTPLGSEIDGLNTYEVDARIIYDDTWGQSIGATVVCNLADLDS